MALGLALNDALLGQKPRAFLQDDFGFCLLFNVLKEQSETDDCDVTDYPVESGSSVSDHVWLKPKELALTIVLSDDIVSLYDPIENAVEGITFTEFVKSIDDRMDLLQSWLESKFPLTYFGHKNDYESMIITSVSRSNNLEVGDNLAIEMSLKQVTIAEAQTVTVSVAGQTSSGTQSRSGAVGGGKPTPPKSWAASVIGIGR